MVHSRHAMEVPQQHINVTITNSCHRGMLLVREKHIWPPDLPQPYDMPYDGSQPKRQILHLKLFFVMHCCLHLPQHLRAWPFA
jgi:hypothetical protein